MADSTSPNLLAFEKTVTAAGTAETLHAAKRVKSVVVKAKTSNTGVVFIGGSDIASTTNDGLSPGDIIDIAPNGWMDLKDLFIDVSVSAEGVDCWATLT